MPKQQFGRKSDSSLTDRDDFKDRQPQQNKAFIEICKYCGQHLTPLSEATDYVAGLVQKPSKTASVVGQFLTL